MRGSRGGDFGGISARLCFVHAAPEEVAHPNGPDHGTNRISIP
jgi:hypothetical protein